MNGSGAGQVRKNDGTQLVESEPPLTIERPDQRAAQQHDLDEVVPVPGLERGVLAVVSEAQDLPGLGLDPGIGAQSSARSGSGRSLRKSLVLRRS
jgi:hypothetical protein